MRFPSPYTIAPYLALAVIIIAAASIRKAHLSTPRQISEDESIYWQQALNVLNFGPAPAIQKTFLRYEQSRELDKYPPPTRIGYTLPLALTMAIARPDPMLAAGALSSLASIAALLLTAIIGCKMLGAWPTIVGVALLATFPADLILAHRAWSDSLVGLICLALAALAARLISAEPASAWHYVLMAALGTAALLIKETCAIVYIPCALAILIQLIYAGARKPAILFAVAIISGALVILALSQLLTGSPLGFLGFIYRAQQSTLANPYTLRWQSGGPVILLQALWTLSPVVIGMAIVGFASLWAAPDAPAVSRSFKLLAIGSAAYLALFAVVPYWQNIRFLSPIFGPLCLLAGRGLVVIWLAAKAKLPPRAALVLQIVGIATIVYTCAAGLQTFDRLTRAGITDEAGRLIIEYVRQLDSKAAVEIY